jgi:organic hydroperoxide reductase OsmC/OhrA
MQDFPHCYKIVASAGADGDLSIAGDGLDSISCAPPAEFGGPGNRWSPETLLVAAVGSCFVLSFRAIASASFPRIRTRRKRIVFCAKPRIAV